MLVSMKVRLKLLKWDALVLRPARTSSRVVLPAPLTPTSAVRMRGRKTPEIPFKISSSAPFPRQGSRRPPAWVCCGASGSSRKSTCLPC